MKKWDLGILFLATVAILLSFRQDSYLSLKLRWTHVLDASYYANGHYPSAAETLPAPVITDLDSDGQKEIIFVTPDCRLKVVEGERTKLSPYTTSAKLLGELPVKAEATLLAHMGVWTGRRPVALAAGYLRKPSPGQLNKQVVAVLTDGWTVMLYDHTLRLQWETTLKDRVDFNLFISEAAITISPHGLHRGDDGVVIVGGRMSTVAAANLEHDHEHRADLDNSTREHQPKSDEESEGAKKDANHFSYFAFDGKTGALRWKHAKGDFYAVDSAHEDEHKTLLSEHSYRLHVIGQTRHLGEVDWREWRTQVVEQLPHSWKNRDDTHLDIRYFKKTRTAGRGGSRDTSQTGAHATGANPLPFAIGGGPGKNAPGLTSLLGGASQNTETSALTTLPTRKMNVVVSHTREGIEVIHAYTGKPVCALAIAADTLATDINGDGALDLITTGATCTADVRSGYPNPEPLWNVDLCTAIVNNWNAKGKGRVTLNEKQLNQQLTNPITLARKDTMFRSAGLGERDVIFFLHNSGWLLSYDPNGKQNWAQYVAGLSTDPASSSASKYTINTASSSTSHSHSAKAFVAAAKPSLSEYLPYGPAYELPETYALAVGASLTIMSGSGSVVTSADIPHGLVMAPPTLGDFNNDGITDIIITTPNAYYGFSVEATTGSLLFPALLVFLLMLMATIALKLHYFPSKLKSRAGRHKHH